MRSEESALTHFREESKRLPGSLRAKRTKILTTCTEAVSFDSSHPFVILVLMKPNQKMMEAAIEAAKESAKNGDYALGAVIEKDGKIISVGTTNLKHENDPTVHGEIVAIRNACAKLQTRRLSGMVLYTTHEPCPMCASAAIWARMGGIVFGATIEDAEGHATERFSWRQINMKCKAVLEAGDPKLELFEEFMREECNELFDLVRG